MNLDMIRRLLRLNIGLLIYGLALSMVINAKIGVPPWDVFAQGVSIQLNTSYGVASIIVSVIVLLVDSWQKIFRIGTGGGSSSVSSTSQ